MWLLQAITEEHNSLLQELTLQEAQAHSRLQEERSKNATLLQPLEGAPLKTEPSLLRDNQQLVDTLQRTEAQVKVKCFDCSSLDPDLKMKLINGFVSVIPRQTLRVKVAQLEEAQTNANSRVSNHKQATQLLQTELQDSRAQVEEKEKAIQSLRNKLRESEVGFPKNAKHTYMQRQTQALMIISILITEKYLTEWCGAGRAAVQPLQNADGAECSNRETPTGVRAF